MLNITANGITVIGPTTVIVEKCGPLEKGMGNHFSILSVFTNRWTPQVGRCPICYWRKNEEMEPKQKQHLVVDVTGGSSKIWCYKEQYCIGTWNVRSMNQGKLEVVKQEMARVNIDTLGISELKWTGMGEFNSGVHYIYYCGPESLRRNGVAIIVN